MQPLVTLLSGPIDVDRLDFMGRDTRGAGVTYGFHELEWILRSLRFAELPRPLGGPAWVVAIDGRKGLTTLAQFLYARANMYRLVYLHKTVRASGCVLLRLLRRVQLLEKSGTKTSTPAQLLRCIESPFNVSLEDSIAIDDSDVWCAIKIWAQHDDKVLRDLSEALLSRQLFKVFELDKRSALILRRLDSPNFGYRLRSLVEQSLEISSEQAPYYYGFDEPKFYVAGRESDDPHKRSWILRKGRFGSTLEPLRNFLLKDGLVSAQSDSLPIEERKYLLVCHWRAHSSFKRLIDSVNHIPQLEVNELPSVPEAFSVLGRLDAPGLNKTVYIGADKQPGRRPTELVALKAYRGDDNVARDVTRPNLVIAPHRNVSHCEIAQSSSNTWLVEGLWSGTLSQVLREQGPLRNLKQLADMGMQLFEGLAHVHLSGIRHTDIKPDNCGILIGPENRSFVIGDFGCCTTQPERVPLSEESLGTLKTRPPELFREVKRIGIVSDVWSLGATIYAMLTNKYPFMPCECELGPLGSTVRECMIQSVSRDLDGKVAIFTESRASVLPEAVNEILSECFAPFEDRAEAAMVAKRFRALYDVINDEQAAAWGRAEHVVALAQQIPSQVLTLAAEAKSIRAEYGRYIPPSTQETLASLSN